MGRLRRLWRALRPPQCPLCWCRPPSLPLHLKTEHSDVEVAQYLEAQR